jgi:hypothetical protein
MRTKAVCRCRSLALGLVLAFTAVSSGQRVREYSASFGFGVGGQGRDTVLVIRRFILDTELSYLAVDPATLATSIVRSRDIVFTGVSLQALQKRFAAKPYSRALEMAAALKDPLQNAGIRSFPETQPGIVLTVDLCPSSKPLDRSLFTGIAEAFAGAGKPVPVAVSISGRWLKSHTDDVQWLKKFIDSVGVSMTWINHSYYHRWNDSLPLNENFLLEKGTDPGAEVLRTEAAFVQNGLLPSVFFRFPGLVSDKAVFMKIIGFGLVPVGSDAWLSKGQKVRNGSIVLVHGNGNDAYGVRLFTALLKNKRQSILEKKWGLLEVKACVAGMTGYVP